MLIPVLFGVSVILFITIRWIPGDIAELKLGDKATPEDVAQLREQLGINRPLVNQYGDWVSGIFTGDWGTSLWTGNSVISEVRRSLPVTLELGVFALFIAILISIPTGIISAIRQDTATDYVVRIIAILGLAVPGFWLGILMLTYSARWFHWTPPIGYVSFFDDPLTNLKQFIMPAFADGFMAAALTMRMMRSALLEVLRQDYIRTAWAKGLRERVVVTRHALKNAFIPVLTVIGNGIGYLLGGTVIFEQIFSLPGLGRLTFSSITLRDYPQLQANVLVIAIWFVLINLIVDVLYSYFDPRIRYA